MSKIELEVKERKDYHKISFTFPDGRRGELRIQDEGSINVNLEGGIIILPYMSNDINIRQKPE